MCSPTLQRSLSGLLSAIRAQAAAVRRSGTRAHHRPPGMAGPEPHESKRPRPAPGMRSPARTRRGPRWRVKRALPAQPPYPARVPLNRLLVSPDGHRFPALTATGTAGSRTLLRLRPAASTSASAHLLAVGQRRHQPTGAGTRQWRLGRRVGAEGAHAATGATVSQKRAGLRQG